MTTPESRPDAEIVKAVRAMLDSGPKGAVGCDTKDLRRVCWLAERFLARSETKREHSPNPKELYADQERFICLLANVRSWPEWDRWKAGHYTTDEMRAEIDAFRAGVECLRTEKGCKYSSCDCAAKVSASGERPEIIK